MPFNINPGSYQGGAYLLAGLSGLGSGLSDALQRWQKEQNQREQSDSLMQMLAQTPDPTDPGDPENPDKPRRTILDQKNYERYLAASGMHRAATGAGIQTALGIYEKLKESQDVRALRRAHLALYQAQTAAAGQNEKPLQLTPEEQAAYDKAGKIALRTTAKSFEAADVPDTEAVDTDAAGNPILSHDESMYRSDGKWKPITDAMRKARDDFKAAQEAAAAAQKKASEAAVPPWWMRMFGAKPQGTATPAPAPAAAPMAEDSTLNAQRPTPNAQPSGQIAPGGKVRVKSPTGQIGLIPAAQLEAALAAGYTQL